MFTWLKKKVLNDVIGGAISHFVTKENWRSFADMILDGLEELASRTDNTLDDRFVAGIRKALDIPDDDEEQEATQ